MSSSKRRGLGRGLDALLGAAEPAAAPNESPEKGMLVLPVGQLEPNRFQPRTDFDETGLDELAESIRAQGIVQPIVVTPKGEGHPGRYNIVAGERRWRAAQRAGLEAVPVVVREAMSDQQLLEMALVENIQREDLNAIEEAEAYRLLSESFSLSQEEIAGRVGKGRTTITNILRLLRLPAEVQDLLRSGRLTAGQARPLLSFPDPRKQIELAERALREGLTARDLEALAAAPQEKQKKEPAAPKVEGDVHTRAATERLTKVFQTKVEIQRRKKGGLIRIHFHSENELIRLFDRLTNEGSMHEE
jgi:ParB family transcriptional regulator, chromosome partitioning protein